MKLEDIKRIAEGRTPGRWMDHNGSVLTTREIYGTHIVAGCDNHRKDAEFIAMAANEIDKFIKLAEAAKALTDYTFFKSTKFGYSFNRDFGELKLAVEDLEKE